MSDSFPVLREESETSRPSRPGGASRPSLELVLEEDEELEELAKEAARSMQEVVREEGSSARSPALPPAPIDPEEAELPEPEEEEEEEEPMHSEALMGVHLARIPFAEPEEKLLRSLSRWVAFAGLLTFALGGLAGYQAIGQESLIFDVIVAVLAIASAVWLLAAARSFRKVAVSDEADQHFLMHGIGYLRSAILLKALLFFTVLALSCFVFSLGASLILLL